MGQTLARRATTPERWRAALDRAVDNGIEPLQVAGSGEWVVTSATRTGTVYRTDGVTCECEAALHGDAVCAHRAVVRFVLGWLTDADPESEPRPLERQYLQPRTLHPRLPNGQLAPIA